MKNHKLHITIIFTLVMWSFSFAQKYTNYTIKDGLPSNQIYTIKQDAKGFLWFLTDKGMVRFNGSEFKIFTTKQGLPKNDVWDALVTPDEKVWYLSKTPELGYVENDTVITFSNVIKNEIINPIFSSRIGNTIYPTGPRKSYKLINGKWQIIQNIAYGNLKWYGQQIYHSTINSLNTNITHDTIKVYNNKKLLVKLFVLKQPLDSDAKRKQLNDSLFVWFSKENYQILNLNSLEFTHRKIKNEIGLNSSKHLRINTVNNKIQISGTGFVGYLDKQYHIKNYYLFPKEINSHFALIDKNENIWFATTSNGVYKLPSSKKLNKYALNNLKTKKFNWIDSTLYTSVDGKGFYKYNTNSQDFNLILKTSNYPFSTVKIDSLDTHFFLSKNEFIQYKNNRFSPINLYRMNNYSEDLSQLVYFNKMLFAVTYFSLIKLNSKSYKYDKEFFISGVNKIFKFNNRLLVATNYGLNEVKNDSLIAITFKNITLTKSIISINKISENKLLLGTDGFGAYITNLDSIYQLPKSNYLTIEGSYIEKDTIWLATNEGIYNYVKDKNSYSLIQTYNSNDGLPSNNINDIAIVNNKILISTNNGVAIIPKKHNKQSQFSSIYFDKVNYNNSNITYKNKVQKYTSNNNINFKISSIDFSEGNTNFTYQYKLEPLQTEWTSTDSKNLTFGELEPKNYKLIIKHKDVKQQFTFQITPLWYQRVISKFLFTSAIIFCIGLILFKIRRRELTKKINKINTQKKLAEYELHALRSQMNPHFVFNSLNAIQYYINKNEIELSEKYLVKFSRLIRKFFDFSRDKFISLEQEISLLNNYLEIEKMRFGEDFNYEFNIDKKLNLNELKIPSMLLQPIVENAVNHGLFHNEGKGVIKINFINDDNKKYIIQISDNGVGLKRSKEIKENSIKTHISKSSEIIKERIELLNKSKDWYITYSINELVNSTGTIVQLTFKNYE